MSLREANLWFLPFWRSVNQYFPFFWSHSNPGTQIYKNNPTTAWNVPPNLFYGQNRTAKWVYEKRINGVWPFWRSLNQYFHFFWSHSNPGTKIYKNSPTTAWNVPPNPFYAQKRTAKWVYEKRIHGFWPFWRLVKQYFPSVLVPFESLFAVWFWP